MATRPVAGTADPYAQLPVASLLALALEVLEAAAIAAALLTALLALVRLAERPARARTAARLVVVERVLVGTLAALLTVPAALVCWLAPLRVRLSEALLVDLRDVGPLLLRRVLVARYWRDAERGGDGDVARFRRREAEFTLRRARAPLAARERRP
jgi:hypothetical protein